MYVPTAVELLTSELEKCKEIQKRQFDEWQERIDEIEASIHLLTGKSPIDLSSERYDDESRDAIKGTEDGI